MAKGRSAKAKTSTDDTKKAGAKKVSTAEAEMDLMEGNKWSIVSAVKDDDTKQCCSDDCDKVAVAVWINEEEPDKEYSLCESCQEEQHGGWPEDFANDANATNTTNATTNKTKESTLEGPPDAKEEEENVDMDIDDKESKSEDVEMQDDEQQNDVEMDENSNADDKDVTMQEEDDESQETNDSTEDKEENKEITDESNTVEEEDDEEEATWDLKKILSLSDVNKEAPIKCGTEDCTLAACSLYVESGTGEKWYGCIDCQDEHFGGWPSAEELPENQKSLSKEHVEGLIAKCSNKKRPAMPPVDPSLSPKRQKTSGTNTITPLGSQAAKGSKVTPTPAKETKKPKQNATLMKKHQEWQNAAIKAGGPDARIIVKKDLAKKVIFELLYDKMKPMNITQIHTELKASVPSPILKSCLDDMALDKSENQFYDSDDDEDDAPIKAKKKSDAPGDEYAGSLAFKGGRNANSSLYYVDHTKQKNNGDGLLPDDRNDLVNKLAQAQEEASVLKAQLQSMAKETTQLLSEPTNEEATAALEKQESEMNDIREQLEAARQLKVNEKHKKRTKNRIDSMVAQWRQRKRLAMNFLLQMEESTEGSISAKKCLSGDGQIDVESDETVIKNAIAYAKKKRAMASRPQVKKVKVSKGLGGKTSGLAAQSSLTNGLTADPNFVAVRLNASGQVERVYLGDDE